jgi:putative flippase GtrA
LPGNAFTVLTRRAKLGRAARFCFVGATGVVINTSVLYLLSRGLRLPLPAASAIAVELAVLSNYTLNNRFTFAAGRPSFRRLAKFNITSLGGLGVNVMIVWLLTRHGVCLLAANLVGIAVAVVVNYTFSVAWVWRGEA